MKYPVIPADSEGLDNCLLLVWDIRVTLFSGFYILTSAKIMVVYAYIFGEDFVSFLLFLLWPIQMGTI